MSSVACGMSARLGFPLLRTPCPGIRAERGPILRPRGDAERYDANFGGGMPRAAGAPPPAWLLLVGDGSVFYPPVDEEDIQEVGPRCCSQRPSRCLPG